MPDSGAVIAEIFFKSDSDDLTSREPSMEIVAIPIDNDVEALFVQGGLIRIQVKRAKVNDNDLDSAAFGPCAGYCTVYEGYISKKMEPPKYNVKTYRVDWCELYRDEEDYFISMRYTGIDLGEDPDFSWGKFG